VSNYSTKLALAGGAALAIGFAQGAWAGAIETAGQGARYIGAGGIGVAEDPVTVFHNPGGVANITGTRIEGDLLYMDAELGYTPPGGKKQSAQKDVYQPGFFVATDALKPVGLGFGIYSPFARDIHYDEDPAANFPELRGKNVRLDFAPVIATKIGDKLAVGGGPIYARLTVKETSPVDPSTGFPEIDSEADGDGWGAALGAHYKATDKVSFGAVWKSRVNVNAEGTSDTRTPGPDSVVLGSSDVDLDWKYPQQVGLGASYRATPAVRVNADITWTEWSYWNEVPVHLQGAPFDPPAYAIDGEDAWKYGIGIEYDANEKTVLRLAYQYDERGIPEDNVSPHKPDAEGSNISAGVGYDVNKNFSIDFAYYITLLHDDDVTSNVHGYPGKYEIDAQGVVVSAIVGL